MTVSDITSCTNIFANCVQNALNLRSVSWNEKGSILDVTQPLKNHWLCMVVILLGWQLNDCSSNKPENQHQKMASWIKLVCPLANDQRECCACSNLTGPCHAQKAAARPTIKLTYLAGSDATPSAPRCLALSTAMAPGAHVAPRVRPRVSIAPSH